MARTRDSGSALPRLSIPPTLNMQQPMLYDGRQPLYSPALPTSLQQSFHAPYPSMQTPMQPFFPSTPGGRPGHRQGASIAQLAAAGIFPPNGMPMTPVGGHFSRPSLMLGPQNFGGGQPFQPRSRRQLSIGGPPKAVLGGPGRKLSPLPASATETPATAVPVKVKKIAVNLPKETIPGDHGEEPAHPEWARIYLSDPFDWKEPDVQPAQLTSGEVYPPDVWKSHMPDTIDVFLPGKSAWERMKQQAIEEKLEKLGVERGSGTAPHVRAVSISSPADPALLYFKLNKLQQSQNTSALNSLSTSPQPPFNLSPSPNQVPPRFMNNRHAHTMSLAQPPPQPFYSTAMPNPYVSVPENAFGFENQPSPITAEPIHAPQGRVPLTISSLAPPLPVSRPDSRPDFSRGFGLDITEEVEEDEEPSHRETIEEASFDTDVPESTTTRADHTETEEAADPDGLATASQSKLHSRHVSHLSAALSLREVGGLSSDVMESQPIMESIIGAEEEDMSLEDAIEEWTGSEEVYASVSDDESIGEWSNPSDEERARQHRVERRLRRRTMQPGDEETPRRLPKFPRPPENTIAVPVHKDDDVISNPSEEEHGSNGYLGQDQYTHSRPQSDGGNRPLPPLPHSRVGSGQPSNFEHSRVQSEREQFAQPSGHKKQGSLTLNPFAKPFVFGVPREPSGSWAPDSLSLESPAPSIPLPTHSRVPSFTKPLNAAAQEFKPGGFTFRPPAGVPQLIFPAPEIPRPLPVPPVAPSPIRAQQGREKRQRRGSSASIEEEGDSMQSFRFPVNTESPLEIRRTGTPRTSLVPSLNPTAEPFTFSGFPTAMPFVPKAPSPLPHSLVPASSEDTLQDDNTAMAEMGDSVQEEFTLPSHSKPKRAPIPLDFKHHTGMSNNTIPAGLFKALINSDERTRRSVRSRLSSREFFDHPRRPSLDDLTVPPISRRISRSRLVTDPGNLENRTERDDVFTESRLHARRRSSLPPDLHSSASSISEVSLPAMDLTARFDLEQYEERLEALLDTKFSEFVEEFSKKDSTNSQSINPSMEAMITEVVSLFRAQLQESAARGLEESETDARGELDFELIKDVIQQGHAESQATIKQDLRDIVSQISLSTGKTLDMDTLVEQMSAKTVTAMAGAIDQLAVRFNSAEHVLAPRERNAVVSELIDALAPILKSLRPETVDYELLTNRLTQAVKPHISQLIDLASDKRETAGLIVDKILPLLPRHPTPAPPLDMDAITLKLVTEVRRAIAPVDAFEIKEQVADLVVERLDSRLAVRDKTFNVETVTAQVTEGISRLLQPMQGISNAIRTLEEGHRSLTSQNGELSSVHKQTLHAIADLPSKVMTAVDALNAAQHELLLKANRNANKRQEPDEDLFFIRSTVDELAASQKTLSFQSDELMHLHKDVLERLNILPETFAAATNVLEGAHATFALTRDASKRELEELRKQNTEHQIQLAKARGAHGQVRVEKDVLSEKLANMEADRDRLRTQVKDLQTSAATKAAEAAAAENRNSELEEALAQALARLQASDVVSQTNRERIAALELANHDLVSDKQQLKAKVETLDLQATFSSRDKDAAAQALEVLQKQHDHLVSQQSHWDDLRHASEQIEMLTTLIGQADNEELKELRRFRDRAKLVEGEHLALQKRFKELESKVANSERAAMTSRQTLAQAQQRSSEWEKRAKEYEGTLERVQTQLDHAEQTQSQLEADYSLAKLQLEEREADDRLIKDRERKAQEQITNLEAQVTRLRTELEKAKQGIPTPATAVPSAYKKMTNGNGNSNGNGNGVKHGPARPDSRASTVWFGESASRSGTPNLRIPAQHSSSHSTERSATPPQGVWASIHAPKNSAYTPPTSMSMRYSNFNPATPKPRHAAQAYSASIPSPTPSSVSLAPTQGENGWWS